MNKYLSQEEKNTLNLEFAYQGAEFRHDRRLL